MVPVLHVVLLQHVDNIVDSSGSHERETASITENRQYLKKKTLSDLLYVHVIVAVLQNCILAMRIVHI